MERVPTKTHFLGLNVPKGLKILSRPVFPKIWSKYGLCSDLRGLGKSIWSTSKKIQQNFRNFFENLPPSRKF